MGDGLDDSSSSDKSEFYKLCLFANNFDRILGNKEKIINQGEIINMQNLGTSIFSIKKMNKGHQLSEKDFILRSPRTGLTLDEFKNLKSKILKKDLNKNTSITKVSKFIKSKNRLNGKKMIYEMEDWQNIDIDNKQDLKNCEKNFIRHIIKKK